MSGEMTTRRRRFQLHLSTCVAIMFVAGVVVWANLRVQQRFEMANRGATVPILLFSYGWPVPLHAGEDLHEEYYDWHNDLEVKERWENYRPPRRALKFTGAWKPLGMLLNGLSLLGVVCASSFVCEYLIRRWTRRPQQAQGGEAT